MALIWFRFSIYLEPISECAYCTGMIVLLGSQKGGCGKSTVATNLAAALAYSADVVLLDADAQGTSAQWSQDREETDAPQVTCVQKYGNIKNTIQDLAGRYEHVVIDAGGRDSQELRTALLAADLVICPFRPSQADVDTAAHLADVTTQAKDFNESLQVSAILTHCPTNPVIRETQEAQAFLQDIDGLQVLHSHIYDRKVYRDSLSDGLGVVESKNEKAAAEIKALIGEIGLRT